MRRALTGAMKARDSTAVAALRAGIAVIDNAEAADPSHAPASTSGRIAGGVAGLGAGEVPRRELAEAEIAERLVDEATRWRSLAGDYVRAGRAEDAADLERQAAIVTAFAQGRHEEWE
jgi:hypothetical protein